MDVQNNFNARGSFGIPEQMKKQIEAAQRPQAKATGDAEATPKPEVAAEPKETPAEQSKLPPVISQEEQAEKEVGVLKDFWEKRLGFTITEKDMRDYAFKGRLIKDNVVIMPRCMRATFQSVTPKELGLVDQHMAVFSDTVKCTKEGYENERALRIMSYGWIKAAEVDGDTIKPARLLGNTPEERYETIQNMGALVVQEAIEAWEGFRVLLKIEIREQHFLKKS